MSPLAAIALGLFLTGAAALADQLCYNHVTASTAPPNWGQPPLIDGSVANGDTRCFVPGATPPCSGPDLGWANSFSYVYNNPDGPVTPDVTVEGIRDDTHLYLSVQAHNSTPTTGGSTDPNNAILVGFDPDNTHTKMQWLVIFPAPIGATNGNKQNAQSVGFYWNQTSLSSPATDPMHYIANPPWLNGAGPGSSNAPCSTPGTTCIQSDLEGAAWTTEIALPIVGPLGNPSTGLILPPTGLYGLYVDVLRVVSGAQWAQAPWPSSAAIPGCAANATCYLDTSLPQTGSGAPSGWGNGTIDPSPSPSCSGVYIGSQNLDISVTNPLNPTPGNNELEAGVPNTFYVNVHNSGLTANNVGVSFSIANFGLPGPLSWQQVANSQPVGGSTIPSGVTQLSSNGWTPSAANYNSTPLNNLHQCILATLSANPPNSTYFVSNTAVQNMNFFGASRVERTAQVSSKGYPVHPLHNTEQEFDISVTTKESVLQKCTDANNPTNARGGDCTPVAQMIETAEACRHTGTYLTDKNKHNVELCQAVGSFGFVAKHPGSVKGWKYHLDGPGLRQPDAQGIYHLKLANDSVVDLTNVVEALEGEGGGKGCGALPSVGVFVLIIGVLALGLLLYRRRKV
jgi:hypothetical protein